MNTLVAASAVQVDVVVREPVSRTPINDRILEIEMNRCLDQGNRCLYCGRTDCRNKWLR